MLPCGSTLRGDSGSDSGVASGVSTLRGGVGDFCCCINVLIGGGACGGAAMLKTPERCFRATLCFPPSVVRGILGSGLRRECVR